MCGAVNLVRYVLGAHQRTSAGYPAWVCDHRAGWAHPTRRSRHTASSDRPSARRSPTNGTASGTRTSGAEEPRSGSLLEISPLFRRELFPAPAE